MIQLSLNSFEERNLIFKNFFFFFPADSKPRTMKTVIILAVSITLSVCF